MITLAALACTLVTPGGSVPAFHTMRLHVSADTVWFVDTVPDRMVPVSAIAYLRRTGEWRVATCPREWVDSIWKAPRQGELLIHVDTPVADGYRVHWTRDVQDPRFRARDRENDTWLQHAVAHADLVSRSGARYDLTIRMPAAERLRLFRLALAGDNAIRPTSAPPFNSEVTWWAALPGQLFFGFGSGAVPTNPNVDDVEEAQLLGGAAMFDQARGRLSPIVRPSMLQSSITGFATAAGALWIGSTSGRAPLLRYDPVRAAWSAYDTTASAFLQQPVLGLASANDTLWLQNFIGVAAVDSRSMRWSVRYARDSSYRLADGADTAVARLGSIPSAYASERTTARMGAEVLADALSLRHRTAFENAVARLDSTKFADFYETYDIAPGDHQGDVNDPFHSQYEPAERVLADTSLVPYLREAMMQDGAVAQMVAGNAMKQIGDSASGDALFVATLHAVIDSGSAEAQTQAADSLMARHDPRGMAWLRRAVTDPRIVADTSLLIVGVPHPVDRVQGMVTESGDRSLALALARALRTGFAKRHPEVLVPVADALAHFPREGAEDARVLDATFAAVADLPRLWQRMLWGMRTDSLVRHDANIRNAVTSIVVQALAMDNARWNRIIAAPPNDDPRDSLRYMLQTVLGAASSIDQRLLTASLVSSFNFDMPDATERHERLIQLTGDVGAPSSPRTAADVAKVRAFWSEWWRTHAATFTPLDLNAGYKALGVWRKMNAR